MDLPNYIKNNFIIATGILFLLMFLFHNSVMAKSRKKMFLLAMLSLMIDVLSVVAQEPFAVTGDPVSVWRYFWSAVGYASRPCIVYFTLCIVMDLEFRSQKLKLLALPLIPNTLLAFSSFVSPIAYTFDENNSFSRGPLGYFCYYILAFYLICIFVSIFQSRKKKPFLFRVVVYATLILSILGMVIEYAFYVEGLSPIIEILSLTYYYIYYQTDVYENDNEAISYSAQHDGLTGLYNRYGFEQLTTDLSQSSEPLMFLISDIDKFKGINDTYGHEIGDHVLQEVAHQFNQAFRSSDSVIRLGGDEFVVLAPGMTSELAKLASDKIKRINESLQHPKNPNMPATSISVGIVFSPNGYHESLYKIADDALYDIKHTTRADVKLVKVDETGEVEAIRIINDK